jgi:hypothetical protein
VLLRQGTSDVRAFLEAPIVGLDKYLLDRFSVADAYLFTVPAGHFLRSTGVAIFQLSHGRSSRC